MDLFLVITTDEERFCDVFYCWFGFKAINVWVRSALAMLNEIKEHEKDYFNIRSVCCRLLFSSLIHSNRLEAKFILSRLLNVECWFQLPLYNLISQIGDIGLHGPVPYCSHLIYNPTKTSEVIIFCTHHSHLALFFIRWCLISIISEIQIISQILQLWRYLSYSLVHSGLFHVSFNILVQVVSNAMQPTSINSY